MKFFPFSLFFGISDHDTYVHRSGRTGRAGRNGTSVLLFSDNEERKLSMYENSLNFKFKRSGPPTANQISEACATFASKRLEKVGPETVSHFLPHARRIINEVLNPEDHISTGESSRGLDFHHFTPNLVFYLNPNLAVTQILLNSLSCCWPNALRR